MERSCTGRAVACCAGERTKVGSVAMGTGTTCNGAAPKELDAEADLSLFWFSLHRFHLERHRTQPYGLRRLPCAGSTH